MLFLKSRHWTFLQFKCFFNIIITQEEDEMGPADDYWNVTKCPFYFYYLLFWVAIQHGWLLNRRLPETEIFLYAEFFVLFPIHSSHAFAKILDVFLQRNCLFWHKAMVSLCFISTVYLTNMCTMFFVIIGNKFKMKEGV